VFVNVLFQKKGNFFFLIISYISPTITSYKQHLALGITTSQNTAYRATQKTHHATKG
jgi:hypothetical protein